MIALRKILRPVLLTCALVCAFWLALPKPPLLDGISFSQCVRDRNGQLLRVTLTTDQKFRVWTSLPKISPALIDATLRFEDKYYRCHPGVNPVALLRSALNLRAGGAHSGASTITMQLARCVSICPPAHSAESSFKLFAPSSWSGITQRPKFLKPT
jgi:penicillin-binding protein 1C